MPRATDGTYTLVTSNPVVPKTPILANGWANPTLSDVADALTFSLDRQGKGPMLAPLVLSGPPTLDLHATSKLYVDGKFASIPPFPEAPIDGKTYGRKDAAWSEVTASGGGGVGKQEVYVQPGDPGAGLQNVLWVDTDEDIPWAGYLPIDGTAVAAAKLSPGKTINGVLFDGTADITPPAPRLSPGAQINGVAFDGTSNITVADATKLPVGGTAAAATKLATARTINGVAFDGTANITIPVGISDGPNDGWNYGRNSGAWQRTVAQLSTSNDVRVIESGSANQGPMISAWVNPPSGAADFLQLTARRLSAPVSGRNWTDGGIITMYGPSYSAAPNCVSITTGTVASQKTTLLDNLGHVQVAQANGPNLIPADSTNRLLLAEGHSTPFMTSGYAFNCYYNTSAGWKYIQNGSAAAFAFDVANANAIIASWGTGTAQTAGVTAKIWTFERTGNAIANNGSWTPTSDARLKTDLTQIDDASVKLRQLTGYVVTRRDRFNEDGSNLRQACLIAQEVETILPEAVFRVQPSSMVEESPFVKDDPNDKSPIRALDYDAVQALMVNAWKELDARVAALEAA